MTSVESSSLPPPLPRLSEMASSAWRFRNFIVSSIVVEFRQRLARSRIGAGWLILQPLAHSAMFALVLSEVLGARVGDIGGSYSYAIYLLAGMLGWSLFVEIFTRSLTVFIDNAALLKKIAFPWICLPLIVAGSALVSNMMLLVATVVILLAVGHQLSATIVLLLVLIPLTVAFALSLGLVLGVINTFVRDTAQVMGVVIQLLFWATPIVYPRSVVPARFIDILSVNPMYPIVSAYQDVIAYNRMPPWNGLLVVAALTAVLSAFSVVLVRRAQRDMVDAL